MKYENGGSYDEDGGSYDEENRNVDERWLLP